MKLLICAGMTGGGIYPALAVLQALENKLDDVLWVGSDDGIENDLIPRLGIPFKTVPAAGVHGVSIKSLPGNISKLVQGYTKARKVIRSFKPDVFFSTGGYLSVPVALAAKRVSSVIFIPDVEPGLALKTLLRFSDHTVISNTKSKEILAGQKNLVYSGYPLRREITRWAKKDAQKEFDLQTNRPVVLVFGGSKGARSINQALYPILPELLQHTQVIHISGTHNWKETEQAIEGLKPSEKHDYHAFPYLHENMGAALAAADLVICRSGASTLGELPYFNLPAVLVPYPHAWRYQKTNADYLANAGGAMILKDEDLESSMKSTILGLLNDKDRLAGMRKAMAELSEPHAAEKIAEVILNAPKSIEKGIKK